MGLGPLLPVSSLLSIQWISFDQVVRIGLGSEAAEGTCPCCGERSSGVHSHHVRTVADSPAHGQRVELKIRLRRFFCDSPDCPQKTFAQQIARQMQLNPHTVQRYAHASQFPEHASPPGGPKALAPFLAELKQRWEQGWRSAVKLHRQLQESGFGGSVHMVRRQLAAWRQQKQPTQPAAPRSPSARAVAWLLLKEQKTDATTKLTAKEQAFLAALHPKWPQLAENLWMVQEFSRVLSQDDPIQLQAWVDLTQEPAILRPIRQFAKNLRRDWDAVLQAVSQPWSNGQVEGQVNRLKMIKRQMYGRANFDLLRARVLQMN